MRLILGYNCIGKIGDNVMNVNNEKAWDYAIGVVQVDGIKPSDEFMELVEKEKRGEITGEDIRRVLVKKYKVKEESGNG